MFGGIDVFHFQGRSTKVVPIQKDGCARYVAIYVQERRVFFQTGTNTRAFAGDDTDIPLERLVTVFFQTDLVGARIVAGRTVRGVSERRFCEFDLTPVSPVN